MELNLEKGHGRHDICKCSCHVCHVRLTKLIPSLAKFVSCRRIEKGHKLSIVHTQNHKVLLL